ncbi:hypothetical protein FOA43_003260 [Brettanomyces nanus]|uniref:DNA mismatch repair protein PMS1 n=1 Tax=Eeniella nana TaxID=13502 RepID=A0A875SA39_EENNA|nr:uncharacterized protein FOA43_003260 [Brettanomyces nanus]QPG75874.1 hypothetical protein FOA43_003260 [Brettanomyces nanus]
MTMPIQRIDYGDVHKITSGQVIIDLTSAVKEVVENALDAESTQVNVIFKNYGLDSITVSDNGTGIRPEDFENICLKHYTSKLTSFEDVETVGTFGFRGEAMSSLCAIAHVSIVTATKEEAPKGCSLKYNQLGVLESKELVSRSCGTSVIIDSLFHNLPVRKIDLTKNIKREYHRAVDFLQCYALISTGVRLIVHHIDSRGRKSIILSTTGSINLKNNMLSVFGSNGMYGLEAVDLNIKVAAKFHREQMALKVSGFVSNASFGQGRSASDRQYWYINKRPVLLPRFSKAINETYKKFNYLQYPTILLNIEVDAKFADVNVTPDKRTVLINNEAAVLEAFREGFHGLFSMNGVKIPKNNGVTEKITERNKKQTTLESFSMGGRNEVVQSENREVSEDESVGSSNSNDSKHIAYPEPITTSKPTDTPDSIADPEPIDDLEPIDSSRPMVDPEPIDDLEPIDSSRPMVDPKSSDDLEPIDSSRPMVDPKSIDDPIESFEPIDALNECVQDTDNTSTLASSSFTSKPASRVTLSKKLGNVAFSTLNVDQMVEFELPKSSTNAKRRKSLISNSCMNKKQKLDDISDNNAEELLTLTVSKKDFMSMQVVGQFNLGFILVTKKNVETGKMDMFIVDQHASDEKYNFERLQKETTFKNQPLVIPQKLELNAVDEMVVINSKKIFEKNGFKLRINMENNPGTRVQLLALPYSKNTIFDLSDFYELINLVRKSDGNPDVRPSKVRSMFAMRACRSSIMIGRPLSKKIMTTVVQHLSGLDKPWNCPHGRPTMRHLVELQGWGAFTEDCQ